MKGDLLLIVDMQNVYDKGGAWECMDAVAAAENVRRIAESGTFNELVKKGGLFADLVKRQVMGASER